MPTQKTNLKVWVMNNKGYETLQLMEKGLVPFLNSHPQLNVEVTVVSWSQAWQRIIAAVKSRQAPDIFQIGTSWTGTLSVLNALLNISDKVRKGGFRERFVPATWSSCEPRGLEGVYAVPWFVEVRVLYYRKEALKKKGLSDLCLSTWESFEKTCAQINGLELNGKRIAAIGVPVFKDQELVHSFAPWIWSNGGDFLSPDGKRAIFHNREAFNGIKFYLNLLQKNYSLLTDKRVKARTIEDELFFYKSCGIIFGNSWVAVTYLPGFLDVFNSVGKSKEIEEYDIALVPSGPAGRFTFCGGSNLAISNFSSHLDEAWELIKFLSSNEFQLQHCQAIGSLPTVSQVLELMFEQETPQNRILKDSYQKYGRGYTLVPLWGSIEIVLVEEFYKILESIKVKQYTEALLTERLNGAAEKVNYLLSL